MQPLSCSKTQWDSAVKINKNISSSNRLTEICLSETNVQVATTTKRVLYTIGRCLTDLLYRSYPKLGRSPKTKLLGIVTK